MLTPCRVRNGRWAAGGRVSINRGRSDGGELFEDGVWVDRMDGLKILVSKLSEVNQLFEVLAVCEGASASRKSQSWMFLRLG